MEIQNVYFVGIGGIGMSALARYFLHEGKRVAGYDRTPTPLTAAIEAEGAEVNYEDSAEAIPATFRNKNNTIVVYTPAVPAEHSQMVWFREQGFGAQMRRITSVHTRKKFRIPATDDTHAPPAPCCNKVHTVALWTPFHATQNKENCNQTRV